MKYCDSIPAVKKVLWSAPGGEDTKITQLSVNCGNTAGASFLLYYRPKGGGEFPITPKLFTPPQMSLWVCPMVPFTMSPGDAITGSASDGTNYNLFLD
jgi:hypothetical protein